MGEIKGKRQRNLGSPMQNDWIKNEPMSEKISALKNESKTKMHTFFEGCKFAKKSTE